jgi:hypothetical protein
MFGLGFVLLWHGDVEAATEQLTASLRSAEQMGNLPLQDRCLAYLTISCRLKADLDQARAYAQQGLEAATAEQNPLYIGVARANLAWLDYRAGRMSAALGNGRAALERWQGFSYPFQWLTRWPLLAIQFSQNNVGEAIDHARAMLDPAQQRLPEGLAGVLERGIQAQDSGQVEAARTHLERALALAQELGFL